jgi:tetratricopeptide (TPR) repeat protein
MRQLKNQKSAVFFLVTVVMMTFVFSGALLGFDYRKVMSIRKDLIRKYKSADKYFKRAKSKFHKGHHIKAEKDLEKCINIFPMHANGEYYLSLISYKKKDYNRALNHIEKAKANALHLKKLSEQFAQERRVKLKEYQKDLKDGKYVSHFGENNPCLVPLGEYFSRVKATDVELLLGTPEKSKSTIPANYFFIHGNIFYKLGRYKEALNQYIEVIKRNPRHAETYNNLANLCYLARQNKKALYFLNLAEACGFDVDPQFKAILE